MDDKIKSNYLSTSETAKHFGVSPNTVRLWDAKGYIKTIRINGTPSGHRRYDISSFSGKCLSPPLIDSVSIPIDSIENPISSPAIGVIYCRVSSRHQKDDLERQIKCLSSSYPNYEVISDIGSGINFKRPGFLKLINRTINGNINEIVVAHKDRLSRFAFDFIKWIFDKYNVSLVVLNESHFKTVEQELAEDLLSIIHVFSCRQNGKRKYLPARSSNN